MGRSAPPTTGAEGLPIAFGHMCGIVALLARPSQRPAPSSTEVLALLDAAVAAANGGSGVQALRATAAPVADADRLLRGVPGVNALVSQPELADAIVARLARLDDYAKAAEAEIEAGRVDDVETANAALIVLRDALWAVRKDRLRTAREVEIGRAHV